MIDLVFRTLVRCTHTVPYVESKSPYHVTIDDLRRCALPARALVHDGAGRTAVPEHPADGQLDPSVPAEHYVRVHLAHVRRRRASRVPLHLRPRTPLQTPHVTTCNSHALHSLCLS